MVPCNIYRSLALFTPLLSNLLINIATPAFAATDITEDKLNTEASSRWAGEGLPFNSVAVIRDPLVNSIVGKVVIDRHGEDNGGGLFKSPFAGPNPGRMTIVTIWGSKEEGCFVKTLVHVAPKGNNSTLNLKEIVPTKLEIGIGSGIIKLSPGANSKPKGASGNYTYSEYANGKTINLRGKYYFTENTFAVNARVADLFRNAPTGNAKVRMTFANGYTTIFPIGDKNVAQWRESYGYNTSCQAKG